MTPEIRSPLAAPATLLQLGLAAADIYLLTLLAAAGTAPRARGSQVPPADGPRHTVLVPAHDEEDLVGHTVGSLRALDFPADRYKVYVIADNCTDSTADVARDAGARVFVRDQPGLPGKGHALAWALSQPDIRRGGEVFVIVDADCEASPNFLAAIDERVRGGARAVQVAYAVANPEDGHTAALRFAGFALVNYLRPLGRTRLGCSAGLLGSGFALTGRVLERLPWEAVSLAEDREYHARLVLAGERVEFAPEAGVRSHMPGTRRAARDQNLRWEAGSRAVARRFGPSLARAGLRRRDLAALEAALDAAVPPQSLLAAANVAAFALALSSRVPIAVRLGVFNLGAQALYVVAGLAIARAPRAVYRALLRAPRLVAWKLGLRMRALVRGAPREWIGTREGVT